MKRLLTILILLVISSTPALGAVTANSLISVQTPKLGEAQILNGTGAAAIASGAATVSNTLTAYTCGANGSKITGMLATSTDTSARDVMVVVVNSSKPYMLTTATVAIGAGTVAGTYAVNLMSPTLMPGLPLDSDGNPYFYCASGDTIAVGVITTAVTANKVVVVLVVGADF